MVKEEEGVRKDRHLHQVINCMIYETEIKYDK